MHNIQRYSLNFLLALIANRHIHAIFTQMCGQHHIQHVVNGLWPECVHAGFMGILPLVCPPYKFEICTGGPHFIVTVIT